MTYQLVTTNRTGTAYPGIKCLECGRISYNPYDIAERYCGYCHRFHEDLLPRGTGQTSQTSMSQTKSQT